MNSKHIKSFLIVIFCLILKAQSIQAQVPTTSDISSITTKLSDDEMRVLRKSFLKGSVQLVFHYDSCMWRGVPADEVNEAFSREEGHGYDATFLSRLQHDFEAAVLSKIRMRIGSQSPFALHVYLKDVNQNAGIKAEGMLYYQNSILLRKMNLDVEDNRWNRFSVLFVENGEELGTIINKNLQAVRRLLRDQGTFTPIKRPQSQRDKDNFTLD